MDDIKFLQFYNEIAQDNFISIAKQNLLFQTQIRVLDEQVKRIPELLEKIDGLEEVKKEFTKVLEENNDLKNQVNNKNNIIENNSKTDVERHRLQTDLNSEMRQNAQHRELIDSLKQTTEKQKEYIDQLEKMLPNSKRKKLGLSVVVEEKNEEVLLVNQNGGTF